MWEDSVQTVAQKIRSPETVLILGASDTGKTTFAIELAMRLVQNEPVAFIDADIGQSRIGPPTTIGWSLIDDPKKDFSQFNMRGVFFVGALSPVGHLLQFTAALIKCAKEAAAAARIVIIDTPGFVGNSAATSLWWAVQEILLPAKILLLQRRDELQSFVEGAKGFNSQLIFINSPPQVQSKSMPQRQAHRQQKFEEYFRNASIYPLALNNIAVQARETFNADMAIHRIIGLMDSGGKNLAVGLIIEWNNKNGVVVVQSPIVNIDEVACLVIGDVTYF